MMSISLEDTYHREGDKSSGFDACTDGIGETMEKMGMRCRELFAADAPPVVIKPLFAALAKEDSQGDGGLANWINWCKLLGKTNLLNWLIMSKNHWWLKG
jgi:hypothetical protein